MIASPAHTGRSKKGQKTEMPLFFGQTGNSTKNGKLIFPFYGYFIELKDFCQ